MDQMQMRNNEETVKPQQLPQQYSSAGFNQANRDQVAPSINQITRRPSISTEQPVGPQSIQRADSRIGAAPQAPLQPNTQQIPVQRPIQQQINAQPQFQPRQILQQPPQQQQQLQQQQFQAPRPVINRGPPPVQQTAPGQQPQQYQQQINRAPVPQQIPQQRPLLARAPIPAQAQNINSGQPVNPNQGNYPPVQNRPLAPQQQFNPNSASEGQGIRPIQQNPQYRPQIQTQPRPINPAYNPNVQKLPTHLEERGKMATEVNSSNPNQPSYLISNTDDVDDVIVRPIGNLKIDQSGGKPEYDLKQQQQPARVSPESQNRTPSVLQNYHAELNNPRPSGIPQKQPENVAKQAPPAKPTVAKRSPTDDIPQKQNGTNGKANDESQARATSRASSHKSQEDIARSSSRSRLKLLEKPAEPVKKVPMNKVKVGNAPPPNLRVVKSKIGSLQNATHKPGGGNVKIEHKKLEFNVQSKIAAKNDNYAPGGGDKKILSTKLTWNAKSKIGSLENKDHKPGGGNAKILNFKTDYGNAKPKVGSKESDPAEKQSSESANE